MVVEFCYRYASALERNPDDYDALYNWALVLQVCEKKMLLCNSSYLKHIEI